MKFYDCATAPSPRRVRIFLAEKGITVPVVQVNLREGEHLQPAFRKINPEAHRTGARTRRRHRHQRRHRHLRVLRGGPSRPAADRPHARGASRHHRLEPPHRTRRLLRRHGSLPQFDAGLEGPRHSRPRRLRADPRARRAGTRPRGRFFAGMDAHLETREFVAGPRYSIADITAQITIEFAKWAKLPIPESCPHLARWFAAVSARPSAKA